MSTQHTNCLVHETSPYLLQHAHNPVDWYPWGDEALQKAKAEDKPILLSIGYSACHWCHVMEHESFEDEGIADIMNDNFVSIKVDREERPDLDHIYQSVVQMLGGQGGWPLTVFLTPAQEPFWGGTYFPPDDRHGRPGFPRVLLALAEHYRNEKDKVASVTEQLKQALDQTNESVGGAESRYDLSLVSHAAERITTIYEPVNGGFGNQPKFPNTKNLELFLRHHARTGDESYLRRVTHTLSKMSEGGIYDQLGGGFHRYSVDDRWLVPHFEKMLYDNALLSKVLIETYQATGDAFFAQKARETLDYVIREMTHPEGGFYSTQDADSEGEEGRFFVWAPGEVFEIVGDRAGAIVCEHLDVTGRGNFEHGNSILHVNRPTRDIARERQLSEVEVETIIQESKLKMFEAREQRVKPFRDEKIMTDWNGMMLSSFAIAAQVFDDDRYRAVARRAAEFVLRHAYRDGALQHVWKDGQAKYPGYLDDYACFGQGLIDLYEATFEEKYLLKAVEMTDTMLAEFWDDERGGLFFTSLRHGPLIHRPKQSFDHSTPSGQSVAVFNLTRLFRFTENSDYRVKAETVFAALSDSMQQHPTGFANLLCALDFHLAPPKEIVLVGSESATAQEMLRAVHMRYRPNKIIAGVPSPNGGAVPILSHKPLVDGRTTAYVCQNFTCSPPVTAAESLAKLLDD